MIKLELLLFLSLLYFSLEQNLYDEQMLSPDPPESTPNNTIIEEQKLFLIGIGNYVRPENKSYLNFTIFFKKNSNYNLILQDYITVTVEINYLRRLRFLEELNANCSKFTKDEINIQYNCTVNEIAPNKTISKLAIPNNKIDLGQGDINFVYSSYANKTMNDIQNQIGDDIKDINILHIEKLDIDYEAKAFTIEGDSYKKNIIDNEIIFSYDRNGRGDLQNFTCKVIEEEGNLKFTCNPQSTINLVTLDGIVGIGKETEKKYLISMEKDKNTPIYFNFNNNYYGKKNPSGGLTGGAIAGIVIACIAALLALSIIAITLRKSPLPPIQESDMDLYNSTSHQNSSNNLNY